MPRSTSPATIDAITARRALLAAQGLLDDPSRPASNRTVFDLVQQLGFVQIDSINTIERAHHLTLFSRLDHYRPEILRFLLEQSRDLFEHWTHDASIIPTHLYPHWKHRFPRHRRRIRENGWWKQRLGPNPLRTVREVRQRIEAEGPLSSKDFEHDRKQHPVAENGWWGWKPQKAALEYLWRTGELAVARRVNFQKVYDLAERVLPKEHYVHGAPSKREHVDWACRSALERLVFATPREIAGFWNAVKLEDVRRWCKAVLRTGEISEVEIQSADGSSSRQKSLAIADWPQRTASLVDPPRQVRFLSPFDPILRDRPRALRVFNFDFHFEAFVPAPKRQFGYYVLPMLEGDRLIGRMDAALKRDRGTLQVNRIWLEPQVKATKLRQLGAIDDALGRLSRFVGASKIERSQPL